MPVTGDAINVIESRVERYTVNETRGVASRWHVEGPWPTAEYLLDCKPAERFARPGETVRFVELHRVTCEMHGLRWEQVTPVSVGGVVLPGRAVNE